MKWISLMCAASLALRAQMIKVSSKTALPGEGTAIVFSIHSAKESNLVGIQWHTVFSARQMSIEGDAVASEAAKAAGKSLTCSRVEEDKKRGVSSFTCILIGGQARIGNGAVGSLRVRISPKAQPGPVLLQVRHVEAVTRDLRKVSLPDAEGKITIGR